MKLLRHLCLLPALIAPQGGTLCDVDNSMFTWFLNANVYYLLYDNDTSLSTARCVCQSVADTRLAIFEAGGDYAGVGMFLTSYHSSDQFWVDAERNLEGELKRACVYLCVCARARARVCVCVCVCV